MRLSWQSKLNDFTLMVCFLWGWEGRVLKEMMRVKAPLSAPSLASFQLQVVTHTVGYN